MKIKINIDNIVKAPTAQDIEHLKNVNEANLYIQSTNLLVQYHLENGKELPLDVSEKRKAAFELVLGLE